MIQNREEGPVEGFAGVRRMLSHLFGVFCFEGFEENFALTL